MEETQSAFVERIRACCPGLNVAAARQTRGQNNDVLIVNDRLVFRFPRYDDAIGHLRRETDLLRAIQPLVPLPIPHPIYASFDPPHAGRAFMGYRMLPGASLLPGLLRTFDDATITAAATRLAAFLRALHALSVDSLPAHLPSADGIEYWRDMYDRIRARLFAHMRPNAQAWTTQHFETFLNDPLSARWTPALRHGDFGPTNILCDPATGEITGVIDFGSVAWGDPAVDIAALSGYGPDFRAAIFSAYPQLRAAAPRIAFYAGTFALQEALFGIEHHDPAAFAAGIAPYR
jgi:aminoglycoside 2''-phosphotransferase